MNQEAKSLVGLTALALISAFLTAQAVGAEKSGVFGRWELTTQSPRGAQIRVLTLKEDMTGTYQTRDSDAPIQDFKVNGDTVTFKVETGFGERSMTMEFKGQLKGNTLNGEFATPRGSRPVEGKRLRDIPPIGPGEAAAKLDELLKEAKASGTVADGEVAAAVIEAAAKEMDKIVLLAKLEQLQAYRKDSMIPAPDKALSRNQKLDWTIITLQTRSQKDVPAEQVKAHPAAAAFPGAVEAGVQRVSREVELWTDRPGWRNRGIYAAWDKKDMQSTGLYAAPGDVITVTVPQGAETAGLNIRIGVHTDSLWHLNQWHRAPEITRVFDITQTVTRAANAFGGPIYIETPHTCKLGRFSVKIDGAVPMPWYVAGKTTDEQWKTIRNNPAPWAELQTDKVVLTLPAKDVRQLEKMDDLMAFWDGVMDSCADLLGKEHNRQRAERFATDVQISAGYMHSGYPLMAGLDISSTLVDKARIVRNGHGGVWGLFHEIGHNHQDAMWVYNGTTEVTVNLFSLYVFENMCGLYPKDNIHDGVLPANREKNLEGYLADGANFEKWKNDPFLALYMYSMIQEEFGWKPFTKVFVEYRAEEEGKLPQNDAEKRDQWLVRLSKMLGKNLGPYFDAWGIPVSSAAKKSIADLPEWMPANFPKSQATPKNPT
ncbi:MAG: M60 family metallopeptidase [Planctomycetales bacterium]|nr:M60 family metallopeptidase [Planctomycetales bacterium]